MIRSDTADGLGDGRPHDPRYVCSEHRLRYPTWSQIAHCIVLGIENAAVVIIVRYRAPSGDALGDLPVGAVPYFLGKAVQYLIAPFPGLLPNLPNCADECAHGRGEPATKSTRKPVSTWTSAPWPIATTSSGPVHQASPCSG